MVQAFAGCRLKPQEPISEVGCLKGLISNTNQDVLDPFFPVSVCADSHQTAVVRRALALEVRREVKQWLRQKLSLGQEDRHEQTADAPVPVTKRMNRFELIVQDGRLNEWRKGSRPVQEPEVAHTLRSPRSFHQ